MAVWKGVFLRLLLFLLGLLSSVDGTEFLLNLFDDLKFGGCIHVDSTFSHEVS